ncbi:MAG: alpha-ketoacid dehydrogenase subunit beta [Actinobacteria bacterium]|nr:alpha-ketoacid dehydrogenase subunit beta [Actinomycetota bacterium]
MITTYAEAISSAIKEEMLRDSNLTIIGEDIGRYGGVFKATKGLYEQFGEKRVKDTPISEAAITGIAIGASLLGYRIIAEIMYVDFLTIASEQIVNQAAKIHYMSGGKLSVPIVIRTQGGAGIRNAAQHSQSLEAWFMHIPGLKVVMPSTPYDAKGLLKSAIRDNNPVIFIEHKKLYSTKGDVPEKEYTIEIGKADVKREGDDITIICNSYMVLIAHQAAEILDGKYNINCEIVDLRTISPLDKDTIIKSVKKTNRVVILHEACEQGGIGGEIISIIQEEAFDYLDYPILRICGPNTPVPYSPELEDYFIPSENTTVNRIVEHFKIPSPI